MVRSLGHSLGIACLGFAALTSGAALAQSNFPNKPIKYVVGFAPGGPSDLISRVVGAKMGEILGTQMIIENKTGAGGVIAIDAVARAEPDGYTLLNAPLSTAVNETLRSPCAIRSAKRSPPSDCRRKR